MNDHRSRVLYLVVRWMCVGFSDAVSYMEYGLFVVRVWSVQYCNTGRCLCVSIYHKEGTKVCLFFILSSHSHA